jgi:RND family efflux transporter MFP subunit
VEQRTTEVQQLAAALAQKRAELAERASDIAAAAGALEKAESDLLQREADITKAEAALRIEEGQQAIAKSEYSMLGRALDDQDRDLVLREPQLRTARANLEAARAAKRSAEAARKMAEADKGAAEAMKRSAEAQVAAAEAAKAAGEVALRKAQLDLERTTIRAPYNAIVEAEAVDLGSQVSPQTALATLIGTDAYWIEVSVPVDKLRWLREPDSRGQKGSTARVFNEAAWGRGVSRAATVVRLAGSLEPEGRMATLRVAVRDPLGLKNPGERLPTLLIGSYVRVEIDGLEIENVVPLERDLLREGDRVWVMTPESTLDIREVTIAFRGRDTLLVSDGLETGDKVVTTALGAPVAGTPLRTAARAAPGTPVAESESAAVMAEGERR